MELFNILFLTSRSRRSGSDILVSDISSSDLTENSRIFLSRPQALTSVREPTLQWTNWVHTCTVYANTTQIQIQIHNTNTQALASAVRDPTLQWTNGSAQHTCTLSTSTQTRMIEPHNTNTRIGKMRSVRKPTLQWTNGSVHTTAHVHKYANTNYWNTQHKYTNTQTQIHGVSTCCTNPLSAGSGTIFNFIIWGAAPTNDRPVVWPIADWWFKQ